MRIAVGATAHSGRPKIVAPDFVEELRVNATVTLEEGLPEDSVEDISGLGRLARLARGQQRMDLVAH